jgi:hypothetical protein
MAAEKRKKGDCASLNAGRSYGLDRRRVLPKSEKAVVRHAQSGFAAGLKATDYLKYDNAWPPPAERVLPFLHGLVGPMRWSVTEQSRGVEIPLRVGTYSNGQLHALRHQQHSPS